MGNQRVPCLPDLALGRIEDQSANFSTVGYQQIEINRSHAA